MKNLILTLIITLPLTLWGQGWVKTFGGLDDNFGNVGPGYSVQQTLDGGYILVGDSYTSDEGSNIYVVKTDQNGNEQWIQTYGGVYNDRGFSIKETDDGGYILTGETTSYETGFLNLILLKIDQNGNEQWSQIYSGISDYGGYSIETTYDGGYIISGYYELSNNYFRMFLLKTNENGNEQWSEVYDNGLNSKGFEVKQTLEGDYILIGREKSVNGMDSLNLKKITNNGDIEWSKNYLKIGYETNKPNGSVDQTLDGGYIITSNIQNNVNYTTDMVLVKTDENGNEHWTKRFGLVEQSIGNSVEQTFDGGYIICGTIGNNVIGRKIFIVKTDENGNEQWSQSLGETGELSMNFSEGFDIQQTLDGGYILCGQTNYNEWTGWDGPGRIEEIVLIKTNGNGDVTMTTEIPLPNPDRKLEKIVNLNGQEVKPQTNTPIIKIFDDGSVEKKLIIEK